MDTVELARYLIGKVAVHDTDDGRLSGRIVETEAYPVGDSAGHAFRGETRRNASLFLGRGHASADVQEIVRAASVGRVENLFLPETGMPSGRSLCAIFRYASENSR